MSETQRKQSKLVENIAGVFIPVLGCLTAASLIKSLVVLLASTGVLATENGIYRILYAVSDGFFYFLPFYLAYTASKQWKTDTFISMMLPAAMLYPDIVAVLENGQSFELLGLTVQPAVYHCGVIPILLAILVQKLAEKPCDRFIPETVKGFLKPICVLIVVLPLLFLVFGPLGSFIGNGLTDLFFWIYEWSPVAAGAFFGFFIQPMVLCGAHWSFVPICINSIATVGYDIILPLLCGAVYGQAGAALAIGVMSKQDKAKRSRAFQASFTAVIGVTEPAIYGVTILEPRAFLSGCTAGALGGMMVGLAGNHCTSFAFPSIVTSVAFIGEGFGIFLLCMPVSMAIGFILTMIQKKKIMQHMTVETEEKP